MDPASDASGINGSVSGAMHESMKGTVSDWMPSIEVLPLPEDWLGVETVVAEPVVAETVVAETMEGQAVEWPQWDRADPDYRALMAMWRSERELEDGNSAYLVNW